MSDSRETDLDLRAVAVGAVGIAVMIVLACAAAWWAWSAWKPAGAGDGPDTPRDTAVAGARLESAPRSDRDAYFQEKKRLLHSWQWADRKAGIARIPIEEAMDLMVRNGRAAPAREPKR